MGYTPVRLSKQPGAPYLNTAPHSFGHPQLEPSETSHTMAVRPSDMYTQLPLSMNPETKDILASSISDLQLANFLASLNTTHKALKQPPCIDCVPPPPVPVAPQRSAAIEKMRAAGNTAFRQLKHDDAIKYYSMGLAMAMTRPPWEPAPLLREEIHQLYNNRAQAHMGKNNWPEALADASMSAEMKKIGNTKAHWRKARCLREMGRLEQARDTLDFGLEFGHDADLAGLLKEIDTELEKREM